MRFFARFGAMGLAILATVTSGGCKPEGSQTTATPVASTPAEPTRALPRATDVLCLIAVEGGDLASLLVESGFRGFPAGGDKETVSILILPEPVSVTTSQKAHWFLDDGELTIKFKDKAPFDVTCKVKKKAKGTMTLCSAKSYPTEPGQYPYSIEIQREGKTGIKLDPMLDVPY